MPCGLPQPSSFWKDSTPTAASAAPKSAATQPRRRRHRRKTTANRNARTSGASTTEATMRSVRYSKYTGEDLGISTEELLKALSDFLLQSGFHTQYMPFSEWNEHTLEDLKQAIQQALERGDLFDNQQMQELMERLQNLTQEQLDQLLDNLIQKMVN